MYLYLSISVFPSKNRVFFNEYILVIRKTSVKMIFYSFLLTCYSYIKSIIHDLSNNGYPTICYSHYWL